MKSKLSTLLGAAFLLGVSPGSSQLFENLQSLAGLRYPVGDPALISTNVYGAEIEGPKDIAVADLDGDGKPDFAASNKDGSVTVRYGVGDGTFSAAQHLRTFVTTPTDAGTRYLTNTYTNVVCNYVLTNVVSTNFASGVPLLWTNAQWVCSGFQTNLETNVWSIIGPEGLRGLALADFTGDGRPDIAVASPGEGVICLFVNQGGRQFANPISRTMWLGVRDLAAGDFDGDGRIDLAASGTTNGLAHLRSLGGGAFQLMTNIASLGTSAIDEDFPQPAYYLKAYRLPDDTRDELVIGRAQATNVWTLRADNSGRLAVQGTLNTRITALDVAPLLRPASEGTPDLLTGFSRDGCVIIYPASTSAARFSMPAAVSFFVPGGPRNVRAVDLDGDGWNDLVVVSQLNDKVITYRNDHGQFTLAAEALAGRSPREMDIGDFNRDGRPDLAVLNRFSFDVSILLTSTNLSAPAGFVTMDNIYPVDGGVNGLEVRDYNGDGRDDVVQLHLATAEISVRLAKTNGMLNPPDFYPFGGRPSAQSVADVNNDGIPDMVSVDLSGSVSVRLGLGDGTFGSERKYVLPENFRGGLYAVVAADFDNDGYVDLAAGYVDCRLVFLKGHGDGTFTVAGDYDHPLYFGYEARSMVAGDFDHDGDLDLAGAGMDGKLTIVENKGNLLTTNQLPLTTYPSPGLFDIRSLQMLDANNDGDWDLFMAGSGGTALYLGGTGVTFTLDQTSLPPRVGGSSTAQADFDGDGIVDLAVANAANKTVTILTRSSADAPYAPVLTVRVPSATYIATGDLDGDGKPDLVGTGEVLWVALSGRHATNAPPAELLAARANRGVVINEVLSKNTGLPLAADGGRLSDWVEIYNGNSQAASLANWQLKLIYTNVITFTMTNLVAGTNQQVVSNLLVMATNVFSFPLDASLPPGGYRVVICDDHLRSLYHTGFELPAKGGLLLLLDGLGIEVDRVLFPALDDDFSYARYSDGSRTFVVNNIPSAGARNLDNGAVDPVITFNGVDFDELLNPALPLRFRATARDDLAVVNVSVLWRRLDIPDGTTKRTILYDDGMSDDAGQNDGIFAGRLVGNLPPGSVIQFYLECTDLSDQIVTTPGSAAFVSPGQVPKTHTLAIGAARPPLEISEIVPFNSGGLMDERGGSPDWVEIRNRSSNTVSLAGVGLGTKFFGDGERMVFTNWPALAPGQHLVIYADGKPGQGPLHSPFKLSRTGAQLLLTGTTTNGGRFLIDAVTYGPMPRNTALARLGASGPWVTTTPTPLAGNVAGIWQGVVDADAFILGFPTRPGRIYTVESKDVLTPAAWTTRQRTRGDGLEQTLRDQMGPKRFFRVRDE